MLVIVNNSVRRILSIVGVVVICGLTVYADSVKEPLKDFLILCASRHRGYFVSEI